MIQRFLIPSYLFILSVLIGGPVACAQDRHFPLNPSLMPTGQAAQWSVRSAPQKYGYFQPVQVKLPSAGHVSYFQGTPHHQVLTQSPSQVGMMVGHTYRVKLSGMPEFPGVELYPTIEILDRLHPPSGEAENFPIPIEIRLDEIALVLQERMVTKVIYLEQPDFAAPFEQGDGIRVEDLPVSSNLLKSADERGRPMAILRIGGRIPDPDSGSGEFYARSPLKIGSE